MHMQLQWTYERKEKGIRHPKEGTFCPSLHQPTHLHAPILSGVALPNQHDWVLCDMGRELGIVVWGECPIKGVLEWKLRIMALFFITNCARYWRGKKNITQAWHTLTNILSSWLFLFNLYQALLKGETQVSIPGTSRTQQYSKNMWSDCVTGK